MGLIMDKKLAQFKAPMKPAETIANSERDEMIEDRRRIASSKTSRKLAETIQEYFWNNKTMPGEAGLRAISNYAAGPENDAVLNIYKVIGDGDSRKGFQEMNRKMAEDYAKTCIKQFKPYAVHVEQIHQDLDIKDLEDGKTSIKCIAQGGRLMTPSTDERDAQTLAFIDEGFLEKHRKTDGMPVRLIAVDNGNGPAGMSFRAIIDLGGEPSDQKKELQLSLADWEFEENQKREPDAELTWDDPNPKERVKQKLMNPDEEDDFTKAVEAISEPELPGLQV